MSYVDKIYDKPLHKIENFAFDKSVVTVFEDMIGRSVPGYHTIVDMTAMLASQYAQTDTNIYDLGCSLGTVTKKITEKCSNKIIAVDNSIDMIERCRKNVQQKNVEVVLDDINNISIKNASVAILNFTLQFIAKKQRLDLLQKIYTNLHSGGILLLSEKIDDKSFLQIKLHESFKRQQGYSILEIEQKKAALKNVMLLDSIEKHQQRLREVGFLHNIVWFQCFNFVSFFCQKQ